MLVNGFLSLKVSVIQSFALNLLPLYTREMRFFALNDKDTLN